MYVLCASKWVKSITKGRIIRWKWLKQDQYAAGLPVLQDCEQSAPLQISISQWKYTCWITQQLQVSALRFKKKKKVIKDKKISMVYFLFPSISSHQGFNCWRLHKWEQLDLKPFVEGGILESSTGDNWQHNSSVTIASERTPTLNSSKSFSWNFSLLGEEYLQKSTYYFWCIHPLTSRFHLFGSCGFLVGVAQQSSSSSTKSSSWCLRTNTSTYTDWPSLVTVWESREE